jgi:hypothetical protein
MLSNRQDDIMKNTQMIEAIDDILDNLAYDIEHPVKTLKIADGREVVLIQANAFTLSRIYATGRPDGKRPHGRSSYLEYFNEQLKDYKNTHDTDEGFSLTPEDWRSLFNESYDRYIRYLLFSGIRRWKDVKKDTETNIAVVDFAKKYAPDEIAWDIYQYKGYILMMKTISQAELCMMRGDLNGAIEEIDNGMNLIGRFCGECLREGREDVENITREKYMNNLIQLRSDIDSVESRLQERMERRGSRINEEFYEEDDFEEFNEELDLERWDEDSE